MVLSPIMYLLIGLEVLVRRISASARRESEMRVLVIGVVAALVLAAWLFRDECQPALQYPNRVGQETRLICFDRWFHSVVWTE